MEKIRDFYAACRENTGSHFLDSGGAYGRHHENPPIDKNGPELVWSEYGVTIDTAHFLDSHLEIDIDIQEKWEKWDNGRSDLSFFESGDKFMAEKMGYTCHARDNVCNGENDLSQVYVWEVWTDCETESDWIYPKGDCITVIYIHTGCDVRGGYGRPLFCRSGDHEYPIPVDLSAGFCIAESRLDDNENRDLSEKWGIGYSSWPMGAMENDIERFFEFTRTIDTVCALLKSGDVVKIQAYMQGPY